MITPDQIAELGKRVAALRRNAEAWWSTAPPTKRNAHAVDLLLQAQALAMEALVGLIEASNDIGMLQGELVERQRGDHHTIQ